MDALATVAPQPVRMTEYSHGSGCGCKISPRLLDESLQTDLEAGECARLLAGNHSKDDDAAFDLGNGNSVISTTDFFMPIVDDPFEFGQIAATNAISDVYAMGGTPPGGAQQNFDSYGDKLGAMSERQRQLLCDPQTSGDLLVAVRAEAEREFHATAAGYGRQLQSIGSRREATGPVRIEVR